MDARVISVQIQQGRAEEMVNIYRDSIVSAAQTQKGFKGCLFLTDPDTNKAVAIALWETEADMKAGEASGYLKEQIAKIAATFPRPLTTDHFEMSVQA